MLVMDSIEQRSAEWFSEKLGKPSASKMDRIITTGGKPSKSAEGYLHELVAERLTGTPADSYQSQAMIEGTEREAESRQLYEFIHGVEVEQVGLIYRDESKQILCSPDGLIKREYGLELKNVLPKTQVAYLLAGKLPSDYFVQVQASMFISGFTKWAFFTYSPGLPPLDLMIERDDTFCSRLKVELDEFLAKLDDVEAQVRRLAA